MKNNKRISYFAILILTLFSVNRCGPAGSMGDGGSTCTPNVIDSKMSLLVTPLGGNVYSFQTCSSSVQPTATFSVYGGPDSNSISQNNFNARGAIRNQNISQLNGSTQPFQVTFQNSDVYFAIYQDQMTGNGPFLDDSGAPIVSPHRLPGL
jgi:hypothetical protein